MRFIGSFRNENERVRNISLYVRSLAENDIDRISTTLRVVT